MRKNLILLLCLAFCACQPNANNNVTPIPPGPTNDSISGELAAVHSVVDSSTIVSPPYDIQTGIAVFFDQPNGNTLISVDSVFLNGKYCFLDQGTKSYYNYPGTDLNGTCNWQVKGNAVVPSFTYNYTASYPSCTVVFPDTVIKANGLTLSLQLAGADSVYVILQNVGGSVGKAVLGNPTSVQFTPAELSPLSVSALYPTGNIHVYAYKSIVQNFSGKKFRFVKQYSRTGEFVAR
jgi:hypothetical protein